MPERVPKTIHEPLGGNHMVLEQSRKRYRVGRRIMLISAALFALSRALYFLPTSSNYETTPAIELLTMAVSIWVWVAAWTICFGLCVRDLFRESGRAGISWLVALLVAWGTTYAISYVGEVIVHGFGSREWYTFATYTFLGGVIFGMLMKIGALKRRGEDV